MVGINDNLDYDPRDSVSLLQRQEEQRKQAQAEKDAENSLYSLVFGTEAGKKLLSKWQNDYVHAWIAEPNATQIGVGIKQGQANFVMSIINRLKQIEKGVPNGR